MQEIVNWLMYNKDIINLIIGSITLVICIILIVLTIIDTTSDSASLINTICFSIICTGLMYFTAMIIIPVVALVVILVMTPIYLLVKLKEHINYKQKWKEVEKYNRKEREKDL